MIHIVRGDDLRSVIGQAVEELGGDPYDLPLGRRQLGVHRVDQPGDMSRAVLPQDFPAGLGDVQQHLPAVGRIVPPADQALLLERGERAGQRLRLGVLGVGERLGGRGAAAVQPGQQRDAGQAHAVRLALRLEASGQPYHSVTNLACRRSALNGRRRKQRIGRSARDGPIDRILRHA